MTDLAGGLVTILPAVMGGLISSGVITYFLGARRSEREVLRTKLEMLYMELSLDLRRKHSECTRCVSDVWELENCHKLTEASETPEQLSESQTHLPADKYVTIINIYFPEAVPAYEKYFSTYQAINGIRLGVQVELLVKGKIHTSRHDEIQLKVQDLMLCAKEVHTSLLYEADKINCSLWRRPFLKRRTNPLM